MEETQERKEEQTQTQSESNVDMLKAFDRVNKAYAEVTNALDEMWKQDKKLCVVTYGLHNIRLSAVMDSKMNLVKKGLEQMVNAE